MEYHANVLAPEGTEEALDSLDPKYYKTVDFFHIKNYHITRC